MKRKIWLVLFIASITILTACSGNDDADTEEETEELHELLVDFEVPEAADVDETLEMKATVTYGDEKVEDAEVVFEFWEQGNQDDSTMVDATNNEDGTYTAEAAFDHDGVFEMYAHTDAKDLHTMPKKAVAVGHAEIDDNGDEPEHEHVEGFEIEFSEPEDVQVDQDVILITDLQMDDEPFEQAKVRYEIWSDAISEKHDWVDAEESADGAYTGTHTFTDAGVYQIMIHVTDDDGLHEHEEYEVEVQ